MSNEKAKVDQHEESKEALRALKDLFQNAVENNSIGDMREHADADFSFVSFTDKSFDSFDAFEKQWNISREQMIGNGKFSTELNPEDSIFVGDIAICKGNANNQMVDKKGKSFEYGSHWTVIFKQNAGVWKVLRAHNSLDPFANPMLRSHVKNTIFKSSALAFLIGGIVCAFFMYLIYN